MSSQEYLDVRSNNTRLGQWALGQSHRPAKDAGGLIDNLQQNDSTKFFATWSLEPYHPQSALQIGMSSTRQHSHFRKRTEEEANLQFCMQSGSLRTRVRHLSEAGWQITPAEFGVAMRYAQGVCGGGGSRSRSDAGLVRPRRKERQPEITEPAFKPVNFCGSGSSVAFLLSLFPADLSVLHHNLVSL